jgi:hypothetical protein
MRCADDAETLELIDIAVQNPVGTNQHTEGGDIITTLKRKPEYTEGGDNVTTLKPDGNARQFALRSLRKHSGDRKSANIKGNNVTLDIPDGTSRMGDMKPLII